MAAAIDSGNKTMTQILIEQGARAIGVQVDSFVCDGVIRLGYGYRGANQADIRLTADEADELVKAINATVPVWGGTAPCGCAALYGYQKNPHRRKLYADHVLLPEMLQRGVSRPQRK